MKKNTLEAVCESENVSMEKTCVEFYFRILADESC